MCFFKQPKIDVPDPIRPAVDNREAMRQAELEASIRRRRAGAAANVLTSPTGIPAAGATTQLGVPGQ